VHAGTTISPLTPGPPRLAYPEKSPRKSRQLDLRHYTSEKGEQPRENSVESDCQKAACSHSCLASALVLTGTGHRPRAVGRPRPRRGPSGPAVRLTRATHVQWKADLSGMGGTVHPNMAVKLHVLDPKTRQRSPFRDGTGADRRGGECDPAQGGRTYDCRTRNGPEQWKEYDPVKERRLCRQLPPVRHCPEHQLAPTVADRAESRRARVPVSRTRGSPGCQRPPIQMACRPA